MNWTRALRRFLARRGCLIVRTEPGLADDLETYLRALVSRGLEFVRVGVLDGDPEAVRTTLSVFDPARVVCCSGPKWDSLPAEFLGAGPLLLEIAAESLSGAAFRTVLPYLKSAAVVIVRAKAEYFWSGEGDALDLDARMRGAGLGFHDILGRPSATQIRPPAENLYFAFERSDLPEEKDGRRERERRRAEALTHLCVPIAGARESLRLAGRGFRQMAGGVCNPGAAQTDQGPILLARGERLPWAVQRRSWASFAASSQPMLLVLQPDLQIAEAAEVRLAGPALPGGGRAEDFRLFAHDGQLYANHSMIGTDSRHSESGPIFPERLRTAVGVSRFDPGERGLTYLGAPALDRPTTRMEKNWAMFSGGASVHLLYSFQPYRLFTAGRFPELTFKSVLERTLPLPFPEDGIPWRNSINPVPYDAIHFLHVVHKVYPTKQYVFWAALIDRVSLLPVKIAVRPLLRGGPRSGASIVYACSVLVRDLEVLVFGGIDDSTIGAWRIPRTELDRQWQSLS